MNETLQNNQKLSFLTAHKQVRGWIEHRTDLGIPTHTVTASGDRSGNREMNNFRVGLGGQLILTCPPCQSLVEPPCKITMELRCLMGRLNCTACARAPAARTKQLRVTRYRYVRISIDDKERICLVMIRRWCCSPCLTPEEQY